LRWCKECWYLWGVGYKEIDSEWHYRKLMFKCIYRPSNIMIETVQCELINEVK
jgi:hypothetical protein